MSELPKYECHLCLEATGKNWKPRCPWALKLAEILIYHRNMNAASDLNLAKSELLQNSVPGLTASMKAMHRVWQCYTLAVLRFPVESSTRQLQIQCDQTVKCYIQSKVLLFPTNILPVRIPFYNIFSDASGPCEGLDLRQLV